MTYFHKQGAIFRATNEQNIEISKTLPLGTYTIMRDMAGYYFEPVEDLKVEGKIYGDVSQRVDRVINTFEDRRGSTGIILQGEKGSGKTMFARLLSSVLHDKGVVTLVINSPLCGEAFNGLINSITQPCVIVFDEFEKVYDNEHQQMLLTLLDGTYTSKKLFVVTCNDFYRVSDFMKNRPGRFFYSFKYEGLSPEFIREYCEDTLNDKSRIDSVVTYTRTFNKMNFDILKAIVEEMNRYNEGVVDAMKFLNATPLDQSYIIELVGIEAVNKETKLIKFDKTINYNSPINPFVNNISAQVWVEAKKGEVIEEEYYDDDDESEVVPVVNQILNDAEKVRNRSMRVTFRPDNLVKMDNGQFFFKNDSFFAIFKRKEEQRMNIEKYLAI